MALIDLIAGARPNFMKIAPIIRAFDGTRENGNGVRYRLVHTGQHYDHAMSGEFFQQLGLPDPDVNLGVRPGSQAELTAAIMVAYEQLLRDSPADLCVVVGDVTSTMACAISARKSGVDVAHVEGGLRSGDWTMPEEINRVVTDSISNWFFTTSETANDNLRRSGVSDDRLFFVGNTMIDTLLEQMRNFRAPVFWSELGLKPREYLVLTLHRPGNVDAQEKLVGLLRAISDAAGECPVVFPVHPRTATHLRELAGSIPRLHYVEPQGYLEFNYLVQHSLGVITDSGGITEETTVMGIPCLTLRDNTERPETISIGTNELVGSNPENVKAAVRRLLAGEWKSGSVPDKWDGKAGKRIVEVLETLVRAEK